MPRSSYLKKSKRTVCRVSSFNKTYNGERIFVDSDVRPVRKQKVSKWLMFLCKADWPTSIKGYDWYTNILKTLFKTRQTTHKITILHKLNGRSKLSWGYSTNCFFNLFTDVSYTSNNRVVTGVFFRGAEL